MIFKLTGEDDILLDGGVNSTLLATASGELVNGFEYRFRDAVVVGTTMDELMSNAKRVMEKLEFESDSVGKVLDLITATAVSMDPETIRLQDDLFLLFDSID